MYLNSSFASAAAVCPCWNTAYDNNDQWQTIHFFWQLESCSRRRSARMTYYECRILLHSSLQQWTRFVAEQCRSLTWQCTTTW